MRQGQNFKKGRPKSLPRSFSTRPLSGYIHHVGSKSVVDPASGRRAGAIAPSDLTRVVHTHEVTQDTIDLPLMDYALERGVLP
jgi:hypothetical protein